MDSYHDKSEQVSNYKSGPKNLEKIFEIKVEEGLDLESEIKDSLLPNLVLQGGTLLSFNVV